MSPNESICWCIERVNRNAKHVYLAQDRSVLIGIKKKTICNNTDYFLFFILDVVDNALQIRMQKRLSSRNIDCNYEAVFTDIVNDFLPIFKAQISRRKFAKTMRTVEIALVCDVEITFLKSTRIPTPLNEA